MKAISRRALIGDGLAAAAVATAVSKIFGQTTDGLRHPGQSKSLSSVAEDKPVSLPVTKNRALFWQFPGFTDSPLGPWTRHLLQARHSRLQCWKLAIDWMADNGVTHFIGVTESWLKGAKQATYTPDWPFHYICSWTEFPKARIFPESILENNRKLFRTILGWMRDKGIKPFLHHYNHMAPFDWFRTQEELIERKLRGPLKGDRPPTRAEVTTRGKSDLAVDICANAPVYRNFMTASWREAFERLPELEGLLITLGENNYCPCAECSAGIPRRLRWDHILTPEFVKTMAGFAGLFTDTLLELGKKPMIRCYHGGGDRGLAPAMPKKATYIFKYSGYNAIDCDPDPISRFWENAGHDLWVIHDFAAQENCTGCLYINPEHSFKVVRRANEQCRISGQVAFHCDLWGSLGLAYPGMEINLEVALAAMRGQEYDEARWERFCIERLGPRGGEYMKAHKLLSAPVLNIDKVVSGNLDDGVCFGFNYHFTGPERFPGVIGELGIMGTEPHPWRSDLGPLRRYKNYLEDHPWCDDIWEKALSPGEKNPVVFWEARTAEAGQGLAMIEAMKVPLDDPYLSVHELMLTSARWIAHFAIFWRGMIHGKVYYWGANSLRTPVETQRKLAGQCLASLEEAIQALEVMKAVYYDYPPLFFHWGKGFFGNTMEEKVAHYRGILEEVRAYFEPLTSGRYYQWPNGGTWSWPERTKGYSR